MAGTAQGGYIDICDICRNSSLVFFHLKGEMVEGTAFTILESEMSQIITETSCRRSPGCWRQSPVSPEPPTPTPTRARARLGTPSRETTSRRRRRRFCARFPPIFMFGAAKEITKGAERDGKKKDRGRDCARAQRIKTLVDGRMGGL